MTFSVNYISKRSQGEFSCRKMMCNITTLEASFLASLSFSPTPNEPSTKNHQCGYLQTMSMVAAFRFPIQLFGKWTFSLSRLQGDKDKAFFLSLLLISTWLLIPTHSCIPVWKGTTVTPARVRPRLLLPHWQLAFPKELLSPGIFILCFPEREPGPSGRRNFQKAQSWGLHTLLTSPTYVQPMRMFLFGS